MDILIGVPTYNNAETIGPLLEAAQAALAQFHGYNGVIVQADGGSTDGTLERVRSAANGPPPIQVSYPLYPVHRLSVPYQGVPGRDSAWRTIFPMARELGVKACCLIDPDLSSPDPEWIGSLLHPVLEFGFDLVTPHYQRHKYDGLLISGVLYPAVRSVFGKRVRQPVGGDFGFSAALIARSLDGDGWKPEVALHQVDLWLTLEAILGDMKICEVYLGPRSRAKKDAAPNLATVLADAVGSLFAGMERTAEVWQRIRGSRSIPAFGLSFDTETDPVPIDLQPMIEAFRMGCRNLQDVWGLILPPAGLLDLQRIARQPNEAFRFSDTLWARIVYDFSVSYRLRSIRRDHLLGALTPLYLGWTSSFILSVQAAHADDVDRRIEELCREFEAQKPYLISRWRWPDRFMP